MSRQWITSVWLAFRDWKFEYLLSACSVVALSSMLAPVFVLLGLENGIIAGMQKRLLEDPAILIITPKSDAGRFSREFIDMLGKIPGARFAIGRTRETAADITLHNPETGLRASISLEPSAKGEPVLENTGIKIPEDGIEPELVLSASSAKSLKAKKGSRLEAALGRKTPQGKLESVKLVFHVADILPEETADRKLAFVPLSLMEDMEDYRDYIKVLRRNYDGNEKTAERQYSSFRLYAKNLDAVQDIAEYLSAKNIETHTRAREIASIKLLKNAIDEIILIISCAVGMGFAAFTVSSALSAVKRKKRMLGMLRLLGMQRYSLLVYSLVQNMFTTASGFFLSLGIYYCVSIAIKKAFLNKANLECLLTSHDIILSACIIFALFVLSSLYAAYTASSVEPSIVIREV